MHRTSFVAFIAAGALATATAVVLPLPARAAASAVPDSWWVLSNHNHSHPSNAYSHDPDHTASSEAFSSDGISAIGQAAQARGIDAVVLSDHNTIRGCHDGNFGSADRTWLCGEEVSAGSAHATVLFPDVPELGPDGQEPFHPYHMMNQFCQSHHCLQHRSGPFWNLPQPAFQTVVDTLHRRGVFTIINHPVAGLPPLLFAGLFPTRLAQARTAGSWAWPYSSTLGADGVEIGLPIGSRQRAAVRFWDRQLTRGVRLTGVAGTDYHHGGTFDGSMTSIDHWVIALPLREDLRTEPVDVQRRAILEALGLGRAQVLARGDVPTRVALTLDLKGARYQIGDTVDLERYDGQTGVLRIAVREPRGGRLFLVRDGKPWGAPILLPHAPNVVVSRRLKLDRPGYVRAVIRDEDSADDRDDVLTNPLYWTSRTASMTTTVNATLVRLRYHVPRGTGAAAFLTRSDTTPYGPSDPAILARAVAAPANGYGTLELETPGPGRYTVSVLPMNASGELLDYRLAATAPITVSEPDRVSERSSPAPTGG